MISEVEPPHENKKKASQPLSLSSLPDEITENILARISRWNYPSLSLVSKRFHSLLSSTQIYKTRSQIGTNETCIYVCLELPDQPCSSWFSIWAKPNESQSKHIETLGFKQDPIGNLVIPISFPSSSSSSSSHSPPVLQQTIRFGSEIYLIGGPYKEPSSSVRILDFGTHTWRDAPSMTVARDEACVALLDEKIYVMGGCDINKYSDKWFEVFDIKTQSWTFLPGPVDSEIRSELMSNLYTFVNLFDGKLYITAAEKDYTYDPKDRIWTLITEKPDYQSAELWCGINNVRYCCTCFRDLMWSDSQSREWREIKGLENLLEHRTRGLKTAGSVHGLFIFDGRLLIMWDPFPSSSIKRRKNRIWYAKISLEPRCNGSVREVWGKVECVDVLTFPGESYEFLECLPILV